MTEIPARMAILSTAHVPQKERDIMWDESDTDLDPMLTGEYAVLFFVPTDGSLDNDADQSPWYTVRLLAWASREGYDYLMLDRDGPELSTMEIFE